MRPRLAVAVAAVTVLMIAATSTGATQQRHQTRGVTNIVLVHGAWADASSWSKVIPLLVVDTIAGSEFVDDRIRLRD